MGAGWSVYWIDGTVLIVVDMCGLVVLSLYVRNDGGDVWELCGVYIGLMGQF